MMAWSQMASMELDDEDQLDARQPIAMPEKPKFPYGLKICLTHIELEKLGLDADCEIGDVIDLRAFACVTSVSKTEDGDGNVCARVELQIEKMAVENEMTEEMDDVE